VNRQFGDPPTPFEGDAVGSLHAFQRAGHRVRLAAEHFQLGARLVIVGGFFRSAQTRVGQAAEVIAPRIAAAAGDGGGQQLVGAAVVAGEVGMYAPPIQLIQQRVLAEAN
jgi:hypothetical protein